MAEDAAARLRVGEVLGISPWVEVTQTDINVFGAVTRDLEPLHNDPKWCETNSPFGGAIAYGFQTIGMLTHLLHAATDSAFSGSHETEDFPINYGFDRMRLITPVVAGSEIRGVFKLLSKEEKRPGELMLRIDATVEIKGKDRPALACEWLYLWVTGEGRSAVGRSVKSGAAA